MSIAAISPSEGIPAVAPSAGPSSSAATDALSASRRVQQLQSLIAQASAGSTASFAAALQAASAGPPEGEQTLASQPSSTGEASSTGLAQTAALSASAYGSPSSTYGSTPVTAGTDLASAESPTLTTGAESPSSSAYDATISAVAARYGLDPAVLHGLIQQESGFNPSAQSGAGALGLTQLMPSTAASLGVSEPLDPTQSIEGGAHYLSEMLQHFGNTAEALAAYNAGPGAVEQYGGVPPYAETQEYVAKVMANANAYRQTHPMAAVNPVLAGAYSTSAVTAAGGTIT